MAIQYINTVQILATTATVVAPIKFQRASVGAPCEAGHKRRTGKTNSMLLRGGSVVHHNLELVNKC